MGGGEQGGGAERRWLYHQEISLVIIYFEFYVDHPTFYVCTAQTNVIIKCILGHAGLMKKSE